MKGRPVLKQFGDLVPADFAEHPVWTGCHTADYDEPWYEETDEETFRPWTGHLPIAAEDDIFLVRAKLTLADGRVLNGFITPQREGRPLNLGLVQPSLFLPSGEMARFWGGIVKTTESRKQALYAELDARAEQIFPIRFAADEGLATGQTSGTIPGFCWLDGGNVRIHY